MVSESDIRRAIVLLLFAIILLFAPVIAYFCGYVDEQDIRVILTAYGPLATVILVLVTWLNLRQVNLDRKRPLRTEELREVIQPLIETLGSNKEMLKSGDIGWHGDIEESRTGTRLRKLTDDGENGVPPVRDRFNQENDALLERIERHDNLVEEVNNKADELASQLQRPVTEQAEGDSIDVDEEIEEELPPSINWLFQDPDPDTLIEFLINNQSSSGLHGHRYQIFWNKKEQDYQELMGETSKEASEQFKESKRELKNLCEELQCSLKDMRGELTARHGISQSEYSERDA